MHIGQAVQHALDGAASSSFDPDLARLRKLASALLTSLPIAVNEREPDLALIITHGGDVFGDLVRRGAELAA